MTPLWEPACQGWEGAGSDFKIWAGNTKCICESQTDNHHVIPWALSVQKSGLGHKNVTYSRLLGAQRGTRICTGSEEPVIPLASVFPNVSKTRTRNQPPIPALSIFHSYVILTTAPFSSEKTKALSDPSSSLFFLPQGVQDLIRFCVCFDISTSAPSTSQWPQMIPAGRSFQLRG